jgi:2-phosphoglycerate kinase
MMDSTDFAWDPFETLHNALWIGGAQWAGKSTVARILAARHDLTAYHLDYHNARGHLDRRAARRARTGPPYAEPTGPDWVRSAPSELVEQGLAVFAEQLEFVFDDLRALVSPHPVLAEGFGLRPETLAPMLDAPGRMVVMVPTEDFRQHQIRTLPRAGSLSTQVSDPERGQANRIARDRLLAEHAVRAAHEHGVRVLEVDGSRDAEAVADEVGSHFAAYLSRGVHERS